MLGAGKMLQLLLFSLIASIQAEIRIGDLTNYYPYSYKTGGEVLVRDEKTIIVRGFTFDANATSTVFFIIVKFFQILFRKKSHNYVNESTL